MKVGCTGCGYCLPCPSGVNIPACFEDYNNLHTMGDANIAKTHYVMRLSGTLSVGTTGYASQCTKCETYLDKCPQHLEISTLLESVVEEIEGDDLEERLAMIKKRFNRT